MSEQEDFKKIINKLNELDLSVHNFDQRSEDASCIIHNYKAHTGNIHAQTHLDVYFLMNQDGGIPFIGNYLMLNSFCNKGVCNE